MSAWRSGHRVAGEWVWLTAILLTVGAEKLLGMGWRRELPDARQTGASGQRSQRTVWEGVFSEAQAARGRQSYRRFCGQCHSDDLSGGGDGEPALKGAIFIAQWQGRSAADLFATMSEAMPYSAPGSLPAQEYVDILSYIFLANDAPAGPGELPIDVASLKQVLITEPAPPRPG
jgi:mono/diheme cytochrome c family protein